MALNLYEVGVRRHLTVMKLSDEDAEAYAERDGLHVKKVGAAKPAAREDVAAPPYAVDENGDELPKDTTGVRRRGRTPRNKQG